MVGLVSQILINPLVLSLLIYIFDVTTGAITLETKIIALLVSVSPGGNFSNMFSYLSTNGQAELSIFMTMISSLLAFGTMPLFLFIVTKIFASELDDEDSGIQLPYAIVAFVAFLATVPVGIGVLCQRFQTKTTRDKVAKVLVILEMINMVTLAFLYLANPLVLTILANMGQTVWWMALCANALGMGLGYLIAYYLPFNFNQTVVRTICFEVGAQNTMIPLAVVSSAFNDVYHLYVGYLVAYVMLSLPVAFFLVFIFVKFYPIQKEEIEDEPAASTKVKDVEETQFSTTSSVGTKGTGGTDQQHVVIK